MKKSMKRRNKKIRSFIYCENIRSFCRLKGKAYKNTFTRNRKIPCEDLLLMTLNKQGKNTSFEIRDFMINKKGDKEEMYSDEAYLKQRRHLNPEVFKEMNKIYLDDFYGEKEFVQRKNGYIVFAIDGSKEEIPNTPRNREEFGYAENQGGVNVARALLSSIYDVYNHFYVDVEIDKYTSSEIELAKINIEKMKKIVGEEKILIIFDRGYPSIEFFYWLEKRKLKFLIRLKSKDYKEEKEQMGSDDEIIELKYSNSRLQSIKKKYPKIYKELKGKSGKEYRFTKIEISEKNTENLISNLTKEEFSKEDIKQLYSKRWEIEKSYDSIKNKLKIESFTGKLPIFVYQDIYAQVFVYNQLEDMLYTGNEELKEVNKSKEKKLEYKINENKAIGIYKEQYIKILLIEEAEERDEEFEKLIKEMERYTTAIRNNRKTQPRKWSYRNKYKTNSKPSF